MSNLTRAQKIDLLKDYKAAKPVEFPTAIDSTCWEFGGEMYIRVDPKTDLPHKSKMRFSPGDFLEYAQKNGKQYFIIWDSTIEAGDLQRDENIIRVGVTKNGG